MTVSVNGFQPYDAFELPSGTHVTANSAGTVTGVAIGRDLDFLLSVNGSRADSSLSPAVNGLYVTRLPLTSGRNSDGTSLGAGASGKFAVSMTAGTSGPVLTTESANNNSKTDTVAFEHVLPRNYVAGQNITITVQAYFTPGSGTLTVKSLTAAAYKCADAATQGSTLVATAAATLIATTATDHTFVITGTTLSPGDRIVITLVTVLTETASSAVTGTINTVKLS